MQHSTIAIILCALHSALCTLPAAVPVRWTVETSRVQPAVFEAYQGETLDLAASLQSYGKPVEIPGPASLFWQTNGMGARWWTAPASFSSNVLSAVWSPTNDVGARVYTCFVGQPGSNYRAEFQLRLRPSPGASPNQLPLPTVTYDARLNGTPTINGTNLIDYVVAASGTDENAVRAIVGSFASTGTVNRTLSVGDADTWTDSTGCVWRVSYSYTEWTYDRSDAPHLFWTDSPYVEYDGGPSYDCTPGWYFFGMSPAQSGQPVSTDREATVVTYMDPGFETYVATRTRYAATNIVGRVALTNDVPSSPSDIGAAPASVADTVQAWQTYWDGDDVRVTVTNYFGSVDHPHLYLEQKMQADETHDEPWFKIIWDEMTRWNAFLGGYAVITNHVERDLADRAWGAYDSSTGEYSPDGYTQISSSNILISAGMAYQKTVTTDGEVWVLTATEPTAISGVTSNGFFRITDGDGNALFEIVKGDKRSVGATAGGIGRTGNWVTIQYNVVADEHPEVEMCTDLADPSWTTPSSVTWSGMSGEYRATIDCSGLQRAFFRATYQLGAETYIRNSAPVGFERVYIGGRSYSVTVETVNGKKLMVLTDD